LENASELDFAMIVLSRSKKAADRPACAGTRAVGIPQW
jgi:hypothetical protein